MGPCNKTHKITYIHDSQQLLTILQFIEDHSTTFDKDVIV